MKTIGTGSDDMAAAAGPGGGGTATAIAVRLDDVAGIPVARLGGEVDLANVGEIRGKLLSAITNAAPGLVLDLTDVTYLDSRGVQLILELAERLKMRHLRLRLVLPETAIVRRVLTLTHVDAVVPIDSAVEAAVEKIRSEG